MEQLFFAAIFLCLIVAILLVVVPFALRQKHYSDKSKLFYVLIIFIVPVISILMYINLGHFVLQKNAWVTNAFLAQMKSPEQVIEQLKARLQQEPNSAEGWYLLGRLYLSQQRYLEAQRAFAKAATLAPNNPVILNNYALSNYLNHNYQQAIGAWLQVLTLIPNDSEDATFVRQAIAKAKAEMKQHKLKKIGK